MPASGRAAGLPRVVGRVRPGLEAGAPIWTAGEVAVVVIAALATIAAARVAQPFLVPVVTGIVLAYALRPLVGLGEGLRLPRMAAAAIVILLVLGLLAGTVYAIRDDLNDAVAELPEAARKLRHAATDVFDAGGPMRHVQAAAAELDKAAAEAAGKRPAPAPTTGVAAEVQTFVAEQSRHALAVFAQLFVALLLAFFLLAAGDTFRRKVARIAGASLARRRVTVEVLNQIDGQIQAYLGTILVTNALIALASWAALAAIGLTGAGMLGVVTGVLHVIPYAGTVVAAAIVAVAAFVETGSIGHAAAALSLVVFIAAVIGIGLATWLQGRAAQMNPVAAFIGVLFFGWLWGGWGLLLGMPLMSVLKCVADRVDAMRPISELLGP